jgi:natural product precursor
MKTLSNLKLAQINKADLEKREMNRLLGGANCCICSCIGVPSGVTTLNIGNSEYSYDGVSDTGGYGSGSFG